MNRHTARELAFKALFGLDFAPEKTLDTLESLWAEKIAEGKIPPEKLVDFSRELVRGVIEKKERLDEIIRRRAIGWDFKRLAKVDKTLLRLALYEMLYRPDIDIPVSIDEAVELAKVYGEEESPKFINGILGYVAEHIDEFWEES
ncbi:transcription antitermination factor NusB [Carboxydothermus hydrogenoformans]|uniref:Transcription antitermination protein NusB n=1 Tax=Carboxydothermus hydrogenoformans (strain ATCC BAA-161 / DSM 6008 / Z-2901) TaxID=246194 RepID=NUSB_CARHZ|nr:transcription antitermination factor NusB [Carboxydothermus hydrogenoformans]Q3AAM1.1 RecName: Full=Transcription antitermination protein NusB; AltName: Full=Antitermination factor NusB [Carboxydothermus hydrogenoformans Z-2901]ABB15975.1 transcription antitermination factor NusB [Carboxydothermus hydrogenoformans Z-2901]